MKRQRYRLGRTLPSEDLSLFCTEMGMLLQSGMAIGDGIAAHIRAQSGALPEKGSKPRNIFEMLYAGIMDDYSLSQSMRNTGVFPEDFISMIRIGEESGSLDAVMAQMAAHYQRDSEVTGEIRSAMVYPLLTLCMMAVILQVLTSRVFPVFTSIYESLGSGLTGAAAASIAVGRGRAGSAGTAGRSAVRHRPLERDGMSDDPQRRPVRRSGWRPAAYRPDRHGWGRGKRHPRRFADRTDHDCHHRRPDRQYPAFGHAAALRHHGGDWLTGGVEMRLYSVPVSQIFLRALKGVAAGAVFIALLLGTVLFSRTTGDNSLEQQRRTTEDSIRHAAVSCYSIEGVYPQKIDYLEEHYGLIVDREKFSIEYEVIGDNILPTIIVGIRGTDVF